MRRDSMDKEKYTQLIEDSAEIFTDVSDRIWEFAELSVKEYRSCDLYVKVLKELGFEVTCPFDNIETAFIGKYGEGHPVIGILAEYDALSGLSQKGGSYVREEIVKNGSGHGCGHNMLGAGSLAAAYGIKKYLEDNPGKGTVIFYGCPGEEGGAAKAFFARDGVFSDTDIALTWHPGDANSVVSGTCNSCIQTEYSFKGIASHAAGAPERGRSALDAVQLMNMGVEFMREHIPDGDRLHYAITDTGGPSPNVVQPHAKVLYMVRSTWVKNALKLQERLDKMAVAASMMTETEMTKQFIDGCSNTVSNSVLEQLLYDNLKAVPLPRYTEEELDYAKHLYDAIEVKNPDLPGVSAGMSKEIVEEIRKLSLDGTKVINDFIVPYEHSDHESRGSTDVGDVSWCIPTAQIHTACFVSKSPGHSWQNVSCGKTSIGHKGLLLAAKVLCRSAIDLYEDHTIIERAKAEFEEKTKGGFLSPVPADAVLRPLED